MNVEYPLSIRGLEIRPLYLHPFKKVVIHLNIWGMIISGWYDIFILTQKRRENEIKSSIK
jgi:hypothetical protein